MLLYQFAKWLVRCGLFFYFRKITFSNKKLLAQQGPLLLACNHPNSFLDAVILGAFFKQPVHFLARGDAFKNSRAASILTALKAIPIYRLTEGKEHLAQNEQTFERCVTILQQGGIVLIFSEGICLNQWLLRNLKKGTARIALETWKRPGLAKEMRIMPVSYNYSCYKAFHKNLYIHFGATIGAGDVPARQRDAAQINVLNAIIYDKLLQGLLIDNNDAARLQFVLSNYHQIESTASNLLDQMQYKLSSLRSATTNQVFKKLAAYKMVTLGKWRLYKAYLLLVLLALPAGVGFITHSVLYYPVRKMIKAKTKETVFYHSALFAVLIIVYPLYYLVLVGIASLTVNVLWFSFILLMPLWGYATVVWAGQFIAVNNYHTLTTKERQTLEDTWNIV